MPGQVFGPDRPTAALRAINRLASLEERAAQFGWWVPGWLQEQLTAAREERSQYADYGDAAAALDRVGRA